MEELEPLGGKGGAGTSGGGGGGSGYTDGSVTVVSTQQVVVNLQMLK